jgi:hypothetical protein
VSRGRIAVLALMVIAGVSVAFAHDNFGHLTARLSGYQEVPTLSTSGSGRLIARINHDETAVDWELSYEDLESAVTQAHIHLGVRAFNGPVIVFFCTNQGNGPAGTQLCPPAPATISGTFMSADVTGGGANVGLEAGNLAELIAAIRAGATYANIHSTGRPGGEVRGQIHVHDRRGDER